MSGQLLLVLLVGAAGGVGLWMLVLLLVPERSDLVTALSRPRGLTASATFAVEPVQQPQRRSVVTCNKISAEPSSGTMNP